MESGESGAAGGPAPVSMTVFRYNYEMSAHIEEGIRTRLADARLLWLAGRKGSAFLLALVALAARSRLERPNASGDRDAFESYLRSTHPWAIQVEYRGKLFTTDQLLYKWMRCELVHTSRLPIDLVIDETFASDDLAVRAGGAPEYLLKMSPAWFEYICSAAECGSQTYNGSPG